MSVTDSKKGGMEMKKIYTIIVLALCAVSCMVSDPSPKTVQWRDLRDYSLNKMGECVVMPAEVLETAIGLDRYLKSTDEEKLADTEFYGMISDYGDGTYGVRCKTKNISFIVATEGKSIWDNDACWQFANIDYYDYYSGMDTYVEYQFNLSEGPALFKEAQMDSTWTFKVEDRLTSHIRMMQTDSLYSWSVVASCREIAKNGISSVASTTSEGIVIRKVWEGTGTAYPYKRNTFKGKFITEISKDNERIDYCIVNFRPGFEATCTTSRNQ